MQPTQLLNSLLRAFRWHRRWFAAILATVAAFAAVSALTQQTSNSVAVVVATKEIPAGTIINAADLTVVRLPSAAVAEGAFESVEQLIGQEVIVNIPARAVLTRFSLLADGIGVGAGRLALPIRFSDSATLTALTVGSTIDVLGQTGSSYAVIASDLRVIAIPNVGQSGAFSSDPGELVMVDVDPAQAGAITSAASAGSLSYALH